MKKKVIKLTESDLERLVRRIVKEDVQSFKDEANVLVTKIANDRTDVDSNSLYDFMVNNQEVIITLASELSKVESNLPKNEFIKILMAYPNDIIKLSENIR
jgi:hypothetical protein